MALHLLIDGYNLIRRSPRLRPEDDLALELGRESLLERLRLYRRLRPHRVTVVFDAAASPRLGSESGSEKGIKVIYSGGGETADQVIKRICRQHGQQMTVVTSDRELAAAVESFGATTLAAEEFEARLEMALYMAVKGEEEPEDTGRWDPKAGTKKKGPAHRQSKRERRRRQRMRKL